MSEITKWRFWVSAVSVLHITYGNKLHLLLIANTTGEKSLEDTKSGALEDGYVREAAYYSRPFFVERKGFMVLISDKLLPKVPSEDPSSGGVR